MMTRIREENTGEKVEIEIVLWKCGKHKFQRKEA
jgi:hypothetical protein